MEKNLTIVYGKNGSGKSSYVRLLKSICNSKGRSDIIGDIYQDDVVTATAAIEIKKDETASKIQWTSGDAPQDFLSHIHIYDAPLAEILMDGNEIIFEPQLLGELSNLTKLFGDISKSLMTEIENCILPNFPDDLIATNVYKKLQAATYNTDPMSLEAEFCWNEQKDAELADLKKVLSEDNPGEKVRQLNDGIKLLSKYKNSLIKYRAGLNDEVENRILEARQALNEKIAAADVAALSFTKLSNLPGVGSEVWKTLWLAARKYSEKHLYPGVVYPNIAEGANCALCHQPLSAEARERFINFDSFIKSTLEQEKNNAQETLVTLVQGLPQIEDNPEIMQLSLEKLGFSQLDIGKILGYYSVMQKKHAKLIQLGESEASSEVKGDDEDVVIVPLEDEFTSLFDTLMKQLNEKTESYQQAAEEQELLKNAYNEMAAERWVMNSPKYIALRCKRLRLEEAIKSTKTNTITGLRVSVSEKMLTSEYISQFKRELELLGASSIQVEMIARGSKGRTIHTIRLKGVKRSAQTDKILSEGEYRVISLASFLAEANLYTKKVPIIFDDPVSSLDIEYEDRVGKRIRELSTERQIIVFTHRLAFVYCLDEDNDQCFIISLMKDPIGLPDESFALEKQKTLTAINYILNNKIPELRKIKNDERHGDYRDGCQALCSQIRIMVEKGIELTLLNGIVMRYRQHINADNVRYLSAITESDVNIFRTMMDKYSPNLHSHSVEKPINLPTLEEIEDDIIQFKGQIEDLINRQKSI